MKFNVVESDLEVNIVIDCIEDNLCFGATIAKDNYNLQTMAYVLGALSEIMLKYNV